MDMKWDPITEPMSPVPSFIPWQGPFHVALNAEESTVLLFRPVFEQLYKKLFGRNKVVVIICLQGNINRDIMLINYYLKNILPRAQCDKTVPVDRELQLTKQGVRQNT